jgi:hypothetical protein
MHQAITMRDLPRTGRATDHVVWTGRFMSGFVIFFLVLDGTMKLIPLQVVIDTMAELGWPADITTARLLGVLTIGATLFYATPRTAVIGAILLTAYLGGAVATHARIGSPLLSHTFFGVYLGLMVWGGLWLRDPRLRALLGRAPEPRGRQRTASEFSVIGTG